MRYLPPGALRLPTSPFAEEAPPTQRLTPIVDLTPLSGITAVNGNVLLVLNDLTNLQGLANIQTIGGELNLSAATSATNLFINSFQSLQSIGGDLIIRGNPGITAISGFPLLRTANSIIISQNAALGG